MSTSNVPNVRFWPIMTAIFFGAFLSILGISTINVALTIFMGDFHASLSTVQWTLTGFMLSLGTIAPLTGYLGDKFGYKNVYLFAMIGFVAFSLLCGFSWNIGSLITFRILQGIFTGLILPATMTIIFQVIPREKQPFAVSIWGLSAMLAPAFGPTISGWLIQQLSWHWLFFINVPIGLLAIVFIMIMIPSYRIGQPSPLDKLGLFTVMASSASLLVALSQGRQWGWDSSKTIGLFAIGALLLAVFIVWELRAKNPLLNLRVFGNYRFSITLVANTIITISLYSGTLLVPLFLQNVQQTSAMDTGLILLPSSLIMALAMPIAGKIYPIVGAKWMTIAGLVLIIYGSYEMTQLHSDSTHFYIILWMAVRNLGVSLAAAATSTAAMEEIGPAMVGHASSVTNWVRNVGGSFAIALFTSLLASHTLTHATDLTQGGQETAQLIPLLSFTMSVNDVFLIATFIAVAAIPFTLLIRRRLKVSQAGTVAA
ncbi:DHA2 family efflux MFS transporter permease subunit [Paenibacillus sacheonensis]|uniref:DHA2 family efflux MFS transporter permease subunit n=1 Tax=Paenibacillus sacheonensis TaxID=742054 RepID=A0A7X4YJY8_9BACL|nr:DHA2 family efflux MFS transporter permease subunit [Paenibacillus sacheonensis]MBM7563859.1 EmrB/QacA subfamily drug resistance transporter [Paenibacillus sacheonensis]NBC67793.1 DHA2 family efflux MFS transporter permease subunit [Paenibacillus sacheonensis]